MIQHFTRGPTGTVDKLNRLVDEVNKNSHLIGDGIIQVQQSSVGKTIGIDRNQLAALVPKIGLVSYALKIFEVQSDAAGDAIYNCYEEHIRNTIWTNTKGSKKTAEKSTDEYEVLNLAEFDPEGVYVRHLAAGDLILAGRYWDNLGTARWAGVPFRLGAHGAGVRLAWCSQAAQGDNTITATLDSTTGSAITVTCHICGGSALNAAVPRLADNDEIFVVKIGATWYCTTIFQTSEDCVCS